jgi:RecA-family ATPase
MGFEYYTLQTVTNIPPVNYLIKGLIPEGLILLSAPPKKGKSLVALDWGLCLGSGLSWKGYPTGQVSVLYVLSEARGTLPPRIKAWETLHGYHSSEITFACGFTNLENYQQVVSDLNMHMPQDGLIIWDTLARNMQGDENDGKTMSAVVRTCDTIYETTGTSNLLVHHSTKEHKLPTGAMVTSSWYRGHSSLLGAVDMGMTIEEDELVCKAPRHDEPFESIPLARRQIAGSVVIDWQSKAATYR